MIFFFFFSSRRRHTRCSRDWSSDVCSSDLEIIGKLGIADQMKPKIKLTGGGPVAEYLAKGDFELGIQQTNVLVGIPGTDYVGPLPGFTNKPCPFNVGLMAVSKQSDLAREMIKFMTS